MLAPSACAACCAIRSVRPLRLSVSDGDRDGRIARHAAHGGWLTLGRLRLWALAVLVASAAGLVYLVATSDGLNDYQGRPLGTDFSNIYVAGTYVLEGRPAAPFDPRLQYAREQQIFGATRRSTAGTIRRCSSPSPPCWRCCRTSSRWSSGRRVTLLLYLLGRRSRHFVMAGLDPAIHDFLQRAKRGCPGQARA